MTDVIQRRGDIGAVKTVTSASTSDLVPIVDGTTGEDKEITIANFRANSFTEQTHIADPAATASDIVDSTGGSASGTHTLAAATNTNALTDNGAGSADATVEDVADIALSTSDTYTDAAVNGAVNTAIASVSNNFKEMTTELALQRSLNTVLINALATVAAEYNTLKDDVEANNTAIDAILVQLAAVGIQASS